MAFVTIPLVALGISCSGGDPESPTGPTAMADNPQLGPAQTWDSHEPLPPVTIEEIAPVLAEMLTAVTEEGLRQGSTTPGPGRWTYACPGGGTARIELPDTLPSAGTVAAADTAVVWTECTMTVAAAGATNGRPLSARSTPIVGRGRLALRLRTWQFWHPVRGPIYTNPNPPIEVQGSLNVNDIGEVPINCATSAASCNGTIGGITTGAPDTPPPPNPTPAPCTVNGVPVPCPAPGPAPEPPAAPAPAPAPAPTGLNVTGTWVVPGQPGGLVLSQATGSTAITGRALDVPIPLPPGTTYTVVTNSITGSVVGNTVTLTHVHAAVLRSSSEGGTIIVNANGNTRYSFQATSSTTMSGTATTTVTTTATCFGSEFCSPPTTNTTTNTLTLTVTKQ